MIHRVAPYADFAGMVEKVPDRQAPSEIRAVIEKKLRQKIEEKKQAHGMKMG